MSRGLGDVYKRQSHPSLPLPPPQQASGFELGSNLGLPMHLNISEQTSLSASINLVTFMARHSILHTRGNESI